MQDPTRSYRLAKQGVFFTWQGEGHLSGLPMVFIRLAGCSVGCPECDTDYESAGWADQFWIAEMACQAFPPAVKDRWVWITGGEPADKPIALLIKALHERGLAVAIATSGIHKIEAPVEWLSVSPHDGRLWQRFGNEIKLVPGLNGLDPFKWLEDNPDSSTDFWFRYVQPLEGSAESRDTCLRFVRANPNWGLTIQAHKFWGLS